MAIGTVTRVAGSAYSPGNKRVRTYDVQLTSGANYTTGGETITPAQAGMFRKIESVCSTGQARTTSGGAATIPVAVEHQSNGSVKLQQYVAATGAEQAAASNQSTFSIRLVFTGF